MSTQNTYQLDLNYANENQCLAFKHKINGNELAFLFPLKFNSRRLMTEYSISVNYFDTISERIYE